MNYKRYNFDVDHDGIPYAYEDPNGQYIEYEKLNNTPLEKWQDLKETIKSWGNTDYINRQTQFVELLYMLGAKIPSSAMENDDNEISFEWRDSNLKIVWWEEEGLTIMLDNKCIDFNEHIKIME